MAHAISVELTRGEYVRNWRHRRRINLRRLAAAMNELLPEGDHVSHSWLSRLEDDNSAHLSVLRALALAHVIGIDVRHLGVTDDEVAQIARLADTGPTVTPPPRRNMRKRPSSCIADRVARQVSSGLVCPVPVAA